MLRSASLRWLLIAAALAGCYYSVLLARAAHLFSKNTAESVKHAVELLPYSSRYVGRLAVWSPKRAELLKRATTLNPFDSESWIHLGLIAEFDRGDTRAAEQYYLKAAEVNHMFLPKWTLANFYFRRQNEAQFFRWAKDTLAITPYAPDPVFTQMWQITRDTTKIAAAIPERPRILLQYASFLSSTSRLAAIPPIVQRLVYCVGSGDARAWGRDDLLAGIEDRLLAAGDLNAAIRVWANMSQAGWIQESAPTAAHPMTNSDFGVRSYGHGFDWVTFTTTGVEIDQFPDEKELRITFSGRQPERCELLRQYIPVEPGGEYQMQWKVTAAQLEAPSGLAWHLRSAQISNLPELVSGDLLSGVESGWRFTAPDANLCVLTLRYARPAGTVKASGTVILNSLSIAQTNR